MESQLVCSIYDEMADHLDPTGNIIKDIDNSTYIRHINLIKNDLNSTSEQHRSAAFYVLRIFADNSVHSIQTDALNILSTGKCIDSEQRQSILSSLGLNCIKLSLANRDIEDLATLHAAWNTTRSPQFADILTAIIADEQQKQHATAVLLNVLLPYILDTNNMQNELMDSRINLAVDFASAIPFSALTAEESEQLTAGIDKYIETMSQLRNENIVYWHKLWIFFVRWFGTKLHDSLNLVNKLLRVVESAFRSTSSEQRLQGYDCWKELIKNAGIDMTYLSSARQLKLLLTPLKAKFSKREPLINKRFEVFVFLLEKLQDKAVLVLKEFLEFCFGETGDSTDMKRSCGFVKRLPELCLKCIEILLLILGHSHENNEKCLNARSDVHLISPVVNSDNIQGVFPYVLEAVSECSKYLKNVQLDCNKAHVLKCLWRSLLRLVLDGQKKPSIHERFRLLGTVLNNLLKGNEPYCQSIAALIFEETVAMGKDKALVLVLSQLDNFLNVIFTVPLDEDRCKLVQHFLEMFDNLDDASMAKLRHHISTSFIQFRTRQQNVDCVRDVWMYAVNELEDYVKGDSLDFLLWPVLYLQLLGEQNEYAIVCEHYKRLLVPFVEKSDELMLAFFKQLEKTVKNNPLLLANVLIILKMFPAKTNRKEIVDVTFTMLDCMLSVPMTGGNKDQIVADIEVLVNRQLAADISTISDPGIIQIVCTCIQDLLKQNHYLVLPHLENLLRESPEATKPLYLKSLDVDFLMEVYSKETETSTEAIPRILQMIKPSDVQQEQPAALALKGRSAKIAKLVKEIPQSPTKVSSTTDVLKYFGKDMETTPKKIMGSQLHKQQGKSPKSTPTSRQKKKSKTSIDDESESKFVLIETEVKVDQNNLTDHQIETLKKRREDIPALYQDLSQSVSQSVDCPLSVDTECFKKPLELNGSNSEELTAIQHENETPESVAEPNEDQEFTEVNHDEPVRAQNTNVENGTADLEHNKEAVELNNDKSDQVPNIEQANGALVKNLPADVAAEVEQATKKENVAKSKISKASDLQDESPNLRSASKTSDKKDERKVDLELKRLSMNIVGADDFVSVGSKRNRRTNIYISSERDLRKCRRDFKHVTADSKVSASQKHNSDAKKEKKSSISVNLTVHENHIDCSCVMCKSVLGETPKQHCSSVPSPDQPETKLDKNKPSSSPEIDENTKIRKTSRISVALKKVQDADLKGSVGRRSSAHVSPAESKDEDNKPLITRSKKVISEPSIEKIEIDDNNQAVVSNGEGKAECKKVNRESESMKVRKQSGRKRKRIVDSDCDDDIIESSQEPSIILKEPRTPARGRPRKRPLKLAASIEAVVQEGESCTETRSAGPAKKRKIYKAIVCKLLNFSAPNLSNVDNDHMYVSPNKNNAAGCDADNKNVDAKVKSTVCKDDLTIEAGTLPPEEENQSKNELKTDISPKTVRQSPESGTVSLRKSPRIQHEVLPPSKDAALDANTKSTVCCNTVDVTPEVDLQNKAESEPGFDRPTLRRLLSTESPVVPKNQKGPQPKEAADEETALAERSLSAEDLVKRTQSQDTQTQESGPIAASGNDVEVQLEVPKKVLLTESEQEIAEMETVSMCSSDFTDLKLYINDTLVEDKTVRRNRITDPGVMDENPDSDQVATDVQADVDSSLPSSPVTVETPNRNAEFLNNTVDISPISFKPKSESEDEQLRITKLVPIALKFDSGDEQPDSPQQKSPEKADDAPLKTNETTTEDAAKESDSDPKTPAKYDQNLEVKKANKLSGFKQPRSPGQKFTGRRKIRYMSPSVSRIKKLMAKVNPQSQKEEYDASKPDDILTFSRAVPSPLATPKIGILKRKHPDIPDDEVSPCPKRKRVNFSDPCTTSEKVFLKYDDAPPQCLFPDDDLDKQFLEVLAANIESYPSTEADSGSSEADCSLESISSLPLREDPPIYPNLVNCEENISVVCRKLTAPMFVNTLLTKLNRKNVKTIGDLARLPVASIAKLPFKAPMVPTVFKVLDRYYHKNFKSKGKVDVSKDVSEAALDQKTDTLPEAEEVGLEGELSKIVKKAISAKIPPKTICSVVLRSQDKKQILTWFKEHSNIEVKDLVEESEFPSLVTHISKTLGVSKLIELLTLEPETSKDFECHISQYVKKLSLAGILEKRSLDEVQAALWESVDKKVFSKNDLLQACFLSRISVLDLNSFFNKLTLVEVGDIVVKRLATEQYTLFMNRIVKHVDGSRDGKLSILNNFDITDLTSNIIQRGTSQEIISAFTCMFLSADKTSEDLVQIFRLVCDQLVDQLPPSQLMELAIDFLRKIPTAK